MSKLFSTPFGRLTALVLALALCLAGFQAADASTSSQASSAQKAAQTASQTIAKTKAGRATARLVGHTGNGRRVTGTFVPLRFSRHAGKLYVRGLVQGVVHEKNGSTTRFAKIKTARVKTINGSPARAGARTSARATCSILNLVLAPLDLDLLGLRVHLDRVVLTIVAATGAGNLLGNLLCAVTGLLDGLGLPAQLSALLNRILSVLRLG
jgi:hypothetical protein